MDAAGRSWAGVAAGMPCMWVKLLLALGWTCGARARPLRQRGRFLPPPPPPPPPPPLAARVSAEGAGVRPGAAAAFDTAGATPTGDSARHVLDPLPAGVAVGARARPQRIGSAATHPVSCSCCLPSCATGALRVQQALMAGPPPPILNAGGGSASKARQAPAGSQRRRRPRQPRPAVPPAMGPASPAAPIQRMRNPQCTLFVSLPPLARWALPPPGPDPGHVPRLNLSFPSHFVSPPCSAAACTRQLSRPVQALAPAQPNVRASKNTTEPFGSLQLGRQQGT